MKDEYILVTHKKVDNHYFFHRFNKPTEEHDVQMYYEDDIEIEFEAIFSKQEGMKRTEKKRKRDLEKSMSKKKKSMNLGFDVLATKMAQFEVRKKTFLLYYVLFLL